MKQSELFGPPTADEYVELARRFDRLTDWSESVRVAVRLGAMWDAMSEVERARAALARMVGEG